jgi:general secretion pathway protein D
VVFAGGGDYLMVRDLVSKLDVPRRQVYVEATILDLSVDLTRNLGLALHQGAADKNGNVSGLVASEGNTTNSLLVTPQSALSALGAGGLIAGVFGKSFNIAGASIPSFGVMLQALEHSKDVNVISQPHLLMMDNNKASLEVGQSIPFPTSTMAAVTGGQTTVYQRQPVSLKLEITPHLNDSDSIRLELDGHIEDVPDAQSGNLQGGPTTNLRTLKTAIVVRDGETVVLGGLQKETQSETVDKIPFLGDIPVLGRLFQQRSKERHKQDLLLVLTPYVIRDADDLRRIYDRKEAERREFIERFTAFSDQSPFSPHVDYRRKRGLLEEINRAAVDAEREGQAVRAAEKTLRVRAPEGPIVVPGEAPDDGPAAPR